ncbi:MAG: hypothetical protein JNK72_24085 [Myxococcales bacterium]|nr:hypothetical protein [Myxococcales bacterium]
MRALALALAALSIVSAPRAAPAQTVVAAERDFTAAQPGRHRLGLDTTGEPQFVVVMQRAPAGTVRPDGTPRAILGSGTCRTPCALFVPPGPLWLRAAGPRLRSTETGIEMPTRDARLSLRSSSSALYNLGTGFVVIGAAVVVVTAVLGIVSQTRISNPDGAPLDTTAVLSLGGIAGALFGAGIPLLVTQRTGVETY